MLLCGTRAVEKRRLDIRDRSSQPAVYDCLRGIDRDCFSIAGDRPIRLRPINRRN